MRVEVVDRVLKANDALAADIRGQLDRAGTVAVNLIGSPGSGKTSLLEQTVSALQHRFRLAVVQGDVATSRDAERIARRGVRAVQIETRLIGNACHLDASMLRTALRHLRLGEIEILFIENVGNLVCPSAYDLGEHLRVVVASVAEGDDKPAKYPSTFARASAVVLNKMDLQPVSDFSLAAFTEGLQEVSAAPLFPLSARTGEGVELWTAWVTAQRQALVSGEPRND